MAQVKTLKIDTNGQPVEIDVSNDDITFASFTVNGGAVLSSTGLDMNNTDISDANDLSFTDPTTDGITRTDGTHAADDIMFQDAENLMASGAAVLFPAIADAADQLDAFRLPAIAGAPSATPADGGEGYLVWDSANDSLYAWDGAAWSNLSIVEEAERTCNEYTAGAAIAVGEIVYISAADTVSLADVSGVGAASRVIGMSGGAAALSNPVKICSAGVVSGLSGLTAGARYFVDPATPGAITTSVPSGSGNKIIQVGYAKSATEMHLQFEYLGRRA